MRSSTTSKRHILRHGDTNQDFTCKLCHAQSRLTDTLCCFISQFTSCSLHICIDPRRHTILDATSTDAKTKDMLLFV